MDTRSNLLEAISAGRLVIVVGTGVTSSLSGAAPSSSWRGLLADGVDRVTELDTEQGTLLEMRLDGATCAEDLASIAGDIKRRLGNNFGRWIARTIGALHTADCRLADALATLQAPILSTNYDTLLETATGRPCVTWKNPDAMRRVLIDQDLAIGHLHGVWQEPDSVVFSDNDYQMIIQDQDAQRIQDAAVTVKSLLFVGVGDGLSDPNFSPLIKRFSDGFPASQQSHFRLCLTKDVNVLSNLAAVTDIPYGDDHADLARYIEELARDSKSDQLGLRNKSRTRLLTTLRRSSTLWRNEASLQEKGFSDLIVRPTFLSKPHNDYATAIATTRKDERPTQINLDDEIRKGGTLIIAGEENSGVTTAVLYVLQRAIDLRQDEHAILVESPMKAVRGPIDREINEVYQAWAPHEDSRAFRSKLVLGVDNIRFDNSKCFRSAMEEVRKAPSPLKVIGVRQSDSMTIATELSQDAAAEEIRILYVGRFSYGEALELATKIAPNHADTVAKNAMTIIRDKSLPRTPFTLTLVVELVQAGSSFRGEESEITVLDEYISLLLNPDSFSGTTQPGMTVRKKRKVLETIAKKFVERAEDAADWGLVLQWTRELFEELEWHFNEHTCINDLIKRRVLKESSAGEIRFQRSAYLELMAGLAAREDPEFREAVFKQPLQLASIVRSYAAMARSDEDVLRLVEHEVDRIRIQPTKGRIFRRVNKVEVHSNIDTLDETAEVTSAAVDEKDDSVQEVGVERDGLVEPRYDHSPDLDPPAFLTARIEDLPASRLAMLVVDLASRVLRESDEVTNQEVKARVLRKILFAWVAFTDLFEQEIAEGPNMDNVVRQILERDEKETDDDSVHRLKALLSLITPTLLVDSGIDFCLASPSLSTRLIAETFDEAEDGLEVGLIRILSLLHSGDTRWVGLLTELSDEAKRTFFCCVYLASVVRYQYLTDDSLTENNRSDIRAFLRQVYDCWHTYNGEMDRSRVLAQRETDLRRDRLAMQQRRSREESEFRKVLSDGSRHA